MQIQVMKKDSFKENKFAVVKRDNGIWFSKAIPSRMEKLEALFFAAYIVAAVDKNGEDFTQILRQVRRV